MATTEITPLEPVELHDVPVLVLQLQDDLTRSRLREAFWISVVVHLLLVIAAVTSPRWGGFRPIAVRSVEEMMRDQQLTYLDLPKDMQKLDKRPDTNVISDKDRIATSRRPILDRKTLQELRDSRPAGAPGAGGPPQAAPAPQPQMAQEQPAQPSPPPPQPQTEARLQTPAMKPGDNPFTRALSPGSAIEQATRAAAGSRIGGGFGGGNGDYGLGGASSATVRGNLEILSDTMGVDFGPYLSRVLHDVRQNWYNLIPEVARAPLRKRGKVSIEFAITREGKVAGMRLMSSSGDVSLDRAAWGGITESNPFAPLPPEFRGPYLALRFHFYYNPERGDLE